MGTCTSKTSTTEMPSQIVPPKRKKLQKKRPSQRRRLEYIPNSTRIGKTCLTCNQPYTTRSVRGWCQPCEARRFHDDFPNWKTGNTALDNLIKESQLNNSAPNQFLEWIPFDMFEGVREIGRGGHGVVYKATWRLGPKLYWDEMRRYWVREGETKVVLKRLYASQLANQEYWNELHSHRSTHSKCVSKWYGFSQDPQSREYIIVSQLTDVDLRQYLRENFKELTWEKKLGIVYNILHGLMELHNSRIVHKNFHSGNILRHYNGSQSLTFITDIGQSRPPLSRSGRREIYGVLPYTAPEVLHGCPCTEASDVYSFGMVMWEIAASRPPFWDRAHDARLAWEICDGLRPEIVVTMPMCYVELMEQCWRADPKERPDIRSLEKTLMSWGWHMGLSQKQRIAEQFVAAEQDRLKMIEEAGDNVMELAFPVLHPKAIYYSRRLNFTDLPESRDRTLMSVIYSDDEYSFIDSINEDNSDIANDDKRCSRAFLREGLVIVMPARLGEESTRVETKSVSSLDSVQEKDQQRKQQERSSIYSLEWTGDEGYEEEHELSFPIMISKSMASEIKNNNNNSLEISLVAYNDRINSKKSSSSLRKDKDLQRCGGGIEI
ncbi:8275_t:CDS:2 [Ambispora leptoticha]|uniref:8275_t:CDS:1 n=1 Tax=Ambispora leptoticha TaxID=144679 RepID=A0A9N9CT09_9GLOM|nr:8275_t:CDS:2 [Ambispora leptoticha]